RQVWRDLLMESRSRRIGSANAPLYRRAGAALSRVRRMAGAPPRSAVSSRCMGEQVDAGRRTAAGEEPGPSDAAVRSADHWSRTLYDAELTFYGFPPLRECHYRCVTGEPSRSPLGRDWFERWTIDTFLQDV